jgi:hypothetical protein
VIKDRLVDDLQDGHFGTEAGKPPGKQAPEADERLPPLRVELVAAVLVVDVHHDQQPGVMEPLDGGFELSAALREDLARGRVHDHARRNAQADVLEPDPSHVLRLGSGDVVVEVLRRVIAGKAEPLADVGTGRQAIQAATRHLARVLVGGGKNVGHRQAAGGNAGQSEEVTSGEG